MAAVLSGLLVIDNEKAAPLSPAHRYPAALGNNISAGLVDGLA